MSEMTPEKGQQRRMALISHDVRAAVADVVGGLQLVDDDRLDEASRLQLDRVRAAGETLSRLLSEAIGSLTGEPSFTYSVSPEHASGQCHVLVDLMRDVERRWAGHAAARGLDLTTDLAHDLPVWVALDPVALERILSNLLDNALKYAGQGRVTLAVQVEPDDALTFCVCDEGPGFSEAALERLFDYEGRPPGSAQPGTGLGLHIAKDMADRLGAILDVRNLPAGLGGDGAPGAASGARGVAGSMVRLIVPRAAWHVAHGSGDAGRMPDLSGLRVLIADDSATNQLVLRRMFERLGADCDVAGDGIAALDALTAGGYDLALVDIHMPRMAGGDVIAAVRALPDERAQVPILAVTAYVLRAHRDEIYAQGADGIIAKPVISLSACAEAVTTLLAKRRARGLPRIEAAGAGEPGPVPSAVSPVRRVHARRLQHLIEIAGPAARDELLERLEADLARATAGLRTGTQAGDMASIRAETHVLISLTGAVGADGLQEMMEAMNAAAHTSDLGAIEVGLALVGAPLDSLVAEIGAERRRVLAGAEAPALGVAQT